MVLVLLGWGVSLAITYMVIRLGVKHGIDSSRVGQLLLQNEGIKLEQYQQGMKEQMSQAERLQQLDRIKKLDEQI